MPVRIADPWLIGVCAVGIPIGILAMVGIGLSRNKPREEIKRDIMVSLFMALTNLAISVILSARLGMEYLDSLGLSIAVSASGSLMAEKFIGKWTQTAVDEKVGQVREDAQAAISEAILRERHGVEAVQARVASKSEDLNNIVSKFDEPQ